MPTLIRFSMIERMAELAQAIIEISPDDLLSCIWYSDGSGARGKAGLPLDVSPDNYAITDISIDTQQQLIKLTVRKISL